jgi:hypothetical protein
MSRISWRSVPQERTITVKKSSMAVVVLALSFLGSALLAPSVRSAWSCDLDVEGRRLDRVRRACNPYYTSQQSVREELRLACRAMAVTLSDRMEAAAWALGGDTRGGTEIKPADAARVRSAYRDTLIDIYVLDLIGQAVLDKASLSPVESGLISIGHEQCVRARDRGVSFEDLRHADGVPARDARPDEVRAAAVETLKIAAELSIPYLAQYVMTAAMPGQETPPP